MTKNISRICLSVLLFPLVLLVPSVSIAKPQLKLNEKGYFDMPGLNVIVFDDIYPSGHQTGVTVIQHGSRVAANGDLRLEVSPGQWSPVPVGGEKTVDEKSQTITQRLSYPDPSQDRKGFNPIIYPDLQFSYDVVVTPKEDGAFRIVLNLDKPLPDEWVGKVGFNFELFPGHLFGKSFQMGETFGTFPVQPNGPLMKVDEEFLAEPLARGERLLVAPESDLQRMSIQTIRGGELELWDGRVNHNNSWFIVRSEVPAGATSGAIEWEIKPNTVRSWKYTPVIQVSQLGYHAKQKKWAVLEHDFRDKKPKKLVLYRIGETGLTPVKKGKPKVWGEFLRYRYFTFDFSEITQAGMYVVGYNGTYSEPFKIGEDTFDRHAWQPTLEYYLPVQMCHMRVNEKYRVWHDLCHLDDARMSPVNHNHFDGYISKESTLTSFKPGEAVPGLDAGGWHDAGDYDLRVESQIGTVWLLSAMVEEFGLNYDATTIDQKSKLVEIHEPDGISDALQQIEHGLLSVMGGYKSLGRLYRGVIVPTNRQYVMLGDAASQTDNLVYDPKLKPGEKTGTHSSVPDDRWVFTEESPDRELYVAAGLAMASRVIKTYRPELAKESLAASQAIYSAAAKQGSPGPKAFALSELFLSTRDAKYMKALEGVVNVLVTNPKDLWPLGRVLPDIKDKKLLNTLNAAVEKYQLTLEDEAASTPYGVPYKPNIWGAGWGIQEFGVRQYFFHTGWPDVASEELFISALNFVLGVHPGENTMSFVSGVGSKSALVAYGVNRADWSFIPGGVISGTALIRPDLPELKIWPFFWQQTEYVMGGGATNYMFLALAVNAKFSP